MTQDNMTIIVYGCARGQQQKTHDRSKTSLINLKAFVENTERGTIMSTKYKYVIAPESRQNKIENKNRTWNKKKHLEKYS